MEPIPHADQERKIKREGVKMGQLVNAPLETKFTLARRQSLVMLHGLPYLHVVNYGNLIKRYVSDTYLLNN